MRRVFKIVVVFLAVFCALSLTVSAASYSKTSLYDEAEIISSADEVIIAKKLAETSKKTGVEYIVFTSSNHDDKSAMFESAYNIIALEIVYTEGTYYYYLYTFGAPNYEITGSEEDRVLDSSEVYDNIKGGRIKEGVIGFCNASATAYEDDLREPLWQTILICFLISAGVAGITVGCVIYKYKKKLKAPSYPLERYANLNLEHRTDNFMGSFITKTKIVQNSSSGGRSGGGRSGGGGGRRGGR